MQETARKNTKYSKNESIFKIAKICLEARPIDFAKSPLLVKILKCQKHKKRFYNHIRVVVCRKPLEKTPNIPKNRAF